MRKSFFRLSSCLLLLTCMLVFSQNIFAWSEGDGTESNPYLITSVEDFQNLIDTINGYHSYTTGSWWNQQTNYVQKNYNGVYFKLTKNLDLSNGFTYHFSNSPNRTNYYFGGTFDGDHHIVSNLTISASSSHNNGGTDDVGLFGELRGTVKNLGVDNASVSSTFKESIGMGYTCAVGVIAGWLNGGTIDGCYVSNVKVGYNNNSATGSYAGGIAGNISNGGVIRNSNALEVEIECNGKNTWKGNHCLAGGISTKENGDEDGTIENCSYSGLVRTNNGYYNYWTSEYVDRGADTTGVKTAEEVQQDIAKNFYGYVGGVCLWENRWNLVGYLGETLNQLNNNNINTTKDTTIDFAALEYNYTTNDWSTDDTHDYIYASTNMQPGDGYFVYPIDSSEQFVYAETNFMTSGNVTIASKTNNGNNVNDAKWFALGNPFDKSLSVQGLINLFGNSINNGLYIYSNREDSAANLNIGWNLLTSNTTYDIYPGQGFMVGNTTGTLPETTLQYPTTQSNKSTPNKENEMIFIAKANNKSKIAYAEMNENVENEFDLMDAFAMFSNSNADLVEPYFVVEEKAIAFNSFKTLPYTSPISFHASKISEVNFSVENVPEGVNVAIVDLNTNAETDLTNGEVFNFIAEEGENAGKYAIKFTKSSVGINEVNANEISMSLYPNPAVDKTTLTINGLDNEATITITDELGRVVNTMSIAAQQTNVTINTDNLASGVYYVKVVSNNTANTQKLIVR